MGGPYSRNETNFVLNHAESPTSASGLRSALGFRARILVRAKLRIFATPMSADRPRFMVKV